MLYDFHTHLDSYEDPMTAITEIANNEITTIASSVDVTSYRKTLQIAKSSELIIPTFGIHPSKAHLYEDTMESLDPYINESPLIGEIGLDYLWAIPLDKQAQIRIFTYIAEKAVEQDKYMVIHTKDAELDILDILDSINATKVIVHWYSGPADLYREYLLRGWYFTYGVELTHSKHIRNLAAMTPLSRILTETDNPVGVEWLDGRIGMPLDIIPVYTHLAEIFGMGIDSFTTAIESNAGDILNHLPV